MARITQNKLMPSFHCGSLENVKKNKNEKLLAKTIEMVRQLVSKNDMK